ncbi:uncharacterized protein LOC131147221 [Malania oleifera]|uniref:uncharacterized protein LOC131147221 n=1 Tax=Malania oleifera TaxID=397392 RepID=UPI0025AEBFBD|nr:uncharacterized protein LOC131147221 [Malania oleifera]
MPSPTPSHHPYTSSPCRSRQRLHQLDLRPSISTLALLLQPQARPAHPAPSRTARTVAAAATSEQSRGLHRRSSAGSIKGKKYLGFQPRAEGDWERGGARALAGGELQREIMWEQAVGKGKKQEKLVRWLSAKSRGRSGGSKRRGRGRSRRSWRSCWWRRAEGDQVGASGEEGGVQVGAGGWEGGGQVGAGGGEGEEAR